MSDNYFPANVAAYKPIDIGTVSTNKLFPEAVADEGSCRPWPEGAMVDMILHYD